MTLSEVLQTPEPAKLESLFSWLPTVFGIVILSPHGYFGQSDVLGLPDTGGQVKQKHTLKMDPTARNMLIMFTITYKMLSIMQI